MTRQRGVNRTRVPLSLAFEQASMLATLFRITVKSLGPTGCRSQNPESFTPMRAIVPAPSEKLVTCYAEWSGAGDRYRSVLPPHMFSKWALPVATRVIEQTRYKLADIVNYGVTMKVNGELPRGVPLRLAVRIKSLKESKTSARLEVEAVSGTDLQPDTLVTTLHILFILSDKRRDRVRSVRLQPQWSTAGRWSAARDDGFRYALLTGDFNPIHWIGLAGRLSPFGRTVLQGMGLLARSYECLVDAGPIKEIDVRFLKSVPLPSAELLVQHTAEDSEGWRALRLAGEGGDVHMSGHYR